MASNPPTHAGGEAPPPYSETDIYSNSGHSETVAGNSVGSNHHEDDLVSSSNGDIIYTPPMSPQVPFAQDNGAALYFETRQPQMPHPESTIIYTIKVDSSSVAEDFPFQSDWEKREVNGQDWATFINYLLPDHTTRGNEVLIDRKLRAETESEHGQTIGSNRSEASAQLEHMRETNPSSPIQDETVRRAEIQATVQQWNDGFFHPRGIDVRLAPASGAMPGGWDASFDESRGVNDHTESNAGGPSANYPWSKSFSISMDSNGVRFGNAIVADGNGLRIGSLTMDGKGIRMGPQESNSSRSLGKQPDYGAGPSHQNRGRGFHPDRHNCHRSRSASSESSVSSADSDSSIGSLPDYDDVKDTQMPLYRSMLQDWTASPNTMRTKADIKDAKAKLKEAKYAAPPSSDFDKKVFKAQIKGLLAQWKHIKRQQKRTRREYKRAQKRQTRAEKRERREHKRDLRRSEREMKRDWRRSERDSARGHWNPPMPPMPPMPPAPHGSSVPPTPPVPPMPPQHPASNGVPMPPMPPMPPMHRGFGNRGFHHHHNHWQNPGMFPFDGHGRGGLSGGPFGRRGRRGRGGLFNWVVNEFGNNSNNSHNRGMPGSWVDDHRSQSPAPPPGPSAAAKYQAAEQLRQSVIGQQEQAENLKPGPERAAIEKSIETMTAQLEKLEMEADEEYAKDVGRHGSGQY